MKELINKSILAAILISLGVAVSLTLNNAIGTFLFAFGLLGVCVLDMNLFTGKCGYWWKDNKKNLLIVLIVNLIAGYICGLLLSIANPALTILATEKIITWSFSIAFFIKSIFCGIIMYLCVDIYKKGEKLGIFFGVPLFIFCGFQHCIANIIILGIAHSFSWTIILAILGNLLGSMIINILQGRNLKK